MRFLVFRLYGPLASWGQAAVGGDRPTGLYPTRSAIIGLLAAALGLKRTEEQALSQLNESLQIAVKQLVPSSLIRDYHTTQVPSTRRGVTHLTRKSELSEEKLNTILSSRDYRCDGMWVVAIRLKKNKVYTLEALQKALIKPIFTLHLGRKSCPLAAPLTPKIIDTHTLKEALDTSFPPLTRSLKEDNLWLKANGWVTYFWEGDKDEFSYVSDDALDDESRKGSVMTTQPWDNPLSRIRWQFSQRIVHQLSIQEDT